MDAEIKKIFKNIQKQLEEFRIISNEELSSTQELHRFFIDVKSKLLKKNLEKEKELIKFNRPSNFNQINNIYLEKRSVPNLKFKS